MDKQHVVIIGGSAAGVEASKGARRHPLVGKVTVIRKEAKVMVPCGIPYIFGTLGAVDKNVIPDAALGDSELLIDEATEIDRGAKTVKTAGGKVIGYDKLILCTGSRPVTPPIPGLDKDNVFAVWKDAEYLEKVEQALKAAKSVVVIGGGFIGVEFADECRKRGLEVTLVELLPHCLALVCDETQCISAEAELEKAGVRVITNDVVSTIGGNRKVEYVELRSAERVYADVVVLGIGAAPETELAQKAGLEIGPTRGIKVDDYMRTSDPDILAAGDCAEKYSFFTGQPVGLRLASIATREAKLAVMNLFEEKVKNVGPMGVFATALGDTAVSVAGLTEKAAADAGFEYVVGEAGAVDKHPGGMPNAKEMKIKLLFDKKTGKMIGGQACGGPSTGEMANVMAALIAGGMTADQVAIFQMGTHPALTASPIVYQLVNAADQALARLS
jgi:NADH oxidase (H2O2-forming)